MLFKFKGVNAQGKRVSEKIEANSLDDAKQRLRSRKILYSSVSEASAPLFKGFKFNRTYKITPKELANFSRDLSIYIKSGISIVNAIRLAQNQYSNDKNMSLFLATLTTFLDEGKNFYQALDEQTVVALPAFYKQSIKVSEDSGILDKVLHELAIYMKEQDRVNKQIQGAFAYPAFIMIVSIMMVGFMIAFVVPKITSIFEQMNQELPPITEFVISVGDWVSSYWLVLTVVMFGFLFLFGLLRKFIKSFLHLTDRLVLKVPLFGRLIHTSELARFAYISSILFESGVPFVQTVNLSAKILKNSIIQEVFLDASKKVVEGDKLSHALQNSDFLVDSSFIQAIALGEETSEVSSILKNLSELYFEENKDTISVLLSMLEPALMLFVGGVIGFIITAMMLPIFSINIG